MFKKILVPSDGSDLAHKAADFASTCLISMSAHSVSPLSNATRLSTHGVPVNHRFIPGAAS